MLVIGEKFVVAGFWSSHALSDDRTHVPKLEPDVAHLFRLGGNSMYIRMYIVVQMVPWKNLRIFSASAGQLPLCKTKCPLPCVGKLM